MMGDDYRCCKPHNKPRILVETIIAGLISLPFSQPVTNYPTELASTVIPGSENLPRQTAKHGVRDPVLTRWSRVIGYLRDDIAGAGSEVPLFDYRDPLFLLFDRR